MRVQGMRWRKNLSNRDISNIPTAHEDAGRKHCLQEIKAISIYVEKLGTNRKK